MFIDFFLKNLKKINRKLISFFFHQKKFNKKKNLIKKNKNKYK